MDIANAFVGPIITKVAEYTVAAVGRQLGYIIFYKKHLDNLDKTRDHLDVVREKVQNMVDVEKRKYCKIPDYVEHWLEKAKLHKPEVSEDKMFPSCFNLIQRHKLGRKAKEMIEEINEIIEKGNTFDQVGYSLLPLPNIDSSSITGYQSIASRMSIAKVIKNALADNDNRMVGIYGMGGVGKTMLVKEVERLLKEHKLFDPVITLTIGQSMDVKDIQKKMKEILRLDFKEETEEAAAAFVRNNLMTMENKILIVVDDLWNKLKLEDVGIPCGCKILITSRDKDVLTNEMGVKTNFIFEVKSLSETEAWEFFKNRIGEIDKISIEPTAIKVAKKCGGLPIALVTVGETLKGKNLHIWKDALKQLQNPTTVKIKGVTTEVYGSLRLSYDFIQNDEAKLIFLLCSVFPDDYDIRLEKLSMYAMGMRLLNGVNTLEEARDRMEALVDVLKSSSLLLEYDNLMNHVKMHDVVRDVAIHISSEEGSQMSTLCRRYEGSTEWRDECGSYRAIFANCDGFHNLPQDLKFLKLELLILIGGSERKELHQTLFAGMEQLKILDLSSLPDLRHLSPERNSDMRHLIGDQVRNNLSCLFLYKMQSLENICHMDVRSNPFNNLRVINVSICDKLKNLFPFPVFEGFSNLQEIQVRGCISMDGIIQMKNEEATIKTECSIVSLIFGGVDHLTSFCSNQLTDVPFFNNQVAFPKLERLEFSRARNLKMLWKNNGMISNSFRKLQRIKIDFCDNVRYMFPCSAMTTLVSLQVLDIWGCESLEAIFEMEEDDGYNVKENDIVPLPKLSYVMLHNCGKLKSVFPASIKRLPRLETLEWYGVPCELLSLESAQSNSSLFHEVVFPSLTRVELSLTAMYRNIMSLFSRSEWFPELKHFYLYDVFYDDVDVDWMRLPLGFRQILCNLEELKILYVNKWKDNTEIWKMFFDYNLELPPSFSNLKSLSIFKCFVLKNLINSSVVKRLVQLEKLFVSRCDDMISILDGEEEEIIFNKLVVMEFDQLKMLESFHFGKSKIIFPCLEKLTISGCDEMKTFSNGIVSAPKIQYLSINGIVSLPTTDINSVLKKKP